MDWTPSAEVIGSLLSRPALLRQIESLTADDFPEGRDRLLFKEIVRQIEENGGEGEASLDYVELARKLGTPDAISTIEDLRDPCSFMTPERPGVFLGAVQKLKHARLAEKISRYARDIESATRGAPFDVDGFLRIQREFSEIQTIGAAPCAGLMELDPASVKVRPIERIGFFPRGMTSAVTGDMGSGKSSVMTDAAARVSSGNRFPILEYPVPPVKGFVFYITSEGVPDKILVPRLIAAGADLANVRIIEGIKGRSGRFEVLDVTKDLSRIERRAKDFRDLALIIVDPIVSFLPERLNPNQANSVRRAMDGLSDLAHRLQVAIVVVMHFAKASAGVKAVHRTAGSGQFEAAIKESWSVVRRQGDPANARLFVPQKSNIGACRKSRSFTIHEAMIPSDDPDIPIRTSKIEWGELVEDDPETLISPPLDLPTNHVARAKEFLAAKLQEGVVLYAKPLINEAEEKGIPKWAMYKAKDILEIEDDKEGNFQGRSFWFKKAPEGESPKDK